METDTAVGEAIEVKPGFGERTALLVRFTLSATRAAITLAILGAFFFMLVGGIFAGHP